MKMEFYPAVVVVAFDPDTGVPSAIRNTATCFRSEAEARLRYGSSFLKLGTSAPIIINMKDPETR